MNINNNMQIANIIAYNDDEKMYHVITRKLNGVL